MPASCVATFVLFPQGKYVRWSKEQKMYIGVGQSEVSTYAQQVIYEMENGYITSEYTVVNPVQLNYRFFFVELLYIILLPKYKQMGVKL